jgi:hypothetical protein
MPTAQDADEARSADGFVPGRELARLFFAEAVAPLIKRHYRELVYSAALLGPGSEVVGFDDVMSADHNWGPRLTIYLAPDDHARIADALHARLAHELPLTYRGYSTHFEPSPLDPRSLISAAPQGYPIRHRVEITTVPAFLQQTIGTDLQQALAVRDWLLIPEQQLRTLTLGAVFHDGLDALLPMQRELGYYPHDVWLYLLSAQWQRIGQEEPLAGRAGMVGDDTGSIIIASRLIRDLMRLGMLMEKQYAPYPKWFGTAFSRLSCAERLVPVLRHALGADDWEVRELALSSAYEIMAGLHNELRITEPVPERVTRFYSRPFMVIQGEQIARAIWETIADREVKALPFGVGKVDQYLDSTDVLSSISRCRSLDAVYDI